MNVLISVEVVFGQLFRKDLEYFTRFALKKAECLSKT